MLITILSGTIGGDAEVRHLQSGDAAINFSVAHSEKYKDKNGVQQATTTWVSCTVWRKSDTIGIAQYLKKGTRVTVSGVPAARAYLDPQGQPKSVLMLNVREIDLQGSPTGAQNNSNSNNDNNQQPVTNESTNSNVFASGLTDNDDLPF